MERIEYGDGNFKYNVLPSFTPGDKKPDNGNDNNNNNPPADNGSQSSGVWTFFKV
jgi:hypothetical protein